MALPRLATLVAVAGGAGVAVGTMALLYYRKVEHVATHSNFVVRAIDIIKEQPVSRDLLGESLQIGKASFEDGCLGQYDIKLKVPVKGDKDSALLYAYARRKDLQSRFRLYKLEATFGKIAGKKLVLLDKTDESDSEDHDEPEEKSTSRSDKDNLIDKKKVEKRERELTPEEAKLLYREQMKNWQPVK